MADKPTADSAAHKALKALKVKEAPKQVKAGYGQTRAAIKGWN
jgi:hypothetical protein